MTFCPDQGKKAEIVTDVYLYFNECGLGQLYDETTYQGVDVRKGGQAGSGL